MINNFNTLIGIMQIVSSLFIFYLVILFELNFISIAQITFRGLVIDQVTSEFFSIASLLFFGFCLSFSGIYMLYLNRKFKII